MPIIAKAQLTISELYDGTDALSVVLSNDSVTIPSNADGSNPVLVGANTIVKVFKGTAEVTPTIGSLSQNNCVATLSGTTVTITSVSADAGYVDIPVSYAGTLLGTFRFRYAKQKQGSTGAAGASYRNMGAWMQGTTYVNNSQFIDTVSYNGSMFASRLATNLNNEPPITATDNTYWKCIVAKGDTGAQGIQGHKGTDGQSLYTWIKYADTPTTGMSDLPTGKKYLGVAYNKTTEVESTNYADYSWSLIEGPQGIQGPSGTNGQSLYTWIKYADTPTTGMNDSPTGKKYMGIAYNKTSATKSTVYTDYSWSLIEGPQGPKGDTGAQGPPGPILDWVSNWDGLKVDIKGDKVISPKIFAGINGGTTAVPILTGVAIGRDVLGGTNSTIGIVGYNANKVTFQLNSDGSAVFGSQANRQFKVNTDGSVIMPKITTNEIESGFADKLVLSSGKGISATVTDAVDNLVISGRNLVLDTAFSNTWVRYNNLGEVSDANEGLKLTFSSATQMAVVSPLTEKLVKGRKYILRLKVRGTLNTCQAWILTKTTPNFNFYNKVGVLSDTEFREFIVPFTYASDNESMSLFIGGIASAVGQWIEIQKNTVKLEEGDKVTGWSLASEDIDKSIQDVSDTIGNISNTVKANTSSITQLSDRISNEVIGKYTTVEEFNKYQTDLATRFTQTDNTFGFKFDKFETIIKDLDGKTTEEYKEIRSYIDFVDGNIILGKKDNQLTLKIANDKIVFIEGGKEVAYFNDNHIYITDAKILNSLKLGKFAFRPRDNGNLSFVWEG